MYGGATKPNMAILYFASIQQIYLVLLALIYFPLTSLSCQYYITIHHACIILHPRYLRQLGAHSMIDVPTSTSPTPPHTKCGSTHYLSTVGDLPVQPTPRNELEWQCFGRKLPQMVVRLCQSNQQPTLHVSNAHCFSSCLPYCCYLFCVHCTFRTAQTYVRTRFWSFLYPFHMDPH